MSPRKFVFRVQAERKWGWISFKASLLLIKCFPRQRFDYSIEKIPHFALFWWTNINYFFKLAEVNFSPINRPEWKLREIKKSRRNKKKKTEALNGIDGTRKYLICWKADLRSVDKKEIHSKKEIFTEHTISGNIKAKLQKRSRKLV